MARFGGSPARTLLPRLERWVFCVDEAASRLPGSTGRHCERNRVGEANTCASKARSLATPSSAERWSAGNHQTIFRFHGGSWTGGGGTNKDVNLLAVACPDINNCFITGDGGFITTSGNAAAPFNTLTSGTTKTVATSRGGTTDTTPADQLTFIAPAPSRSPSSSAAVASAAGLPPTSTGAGDGWRIALLGTTLLLLASAGAAAFRGRA
jgi:hypothetical protein